MGKVVGSANANANGEDGVGRRLNGISAGLLCCEALLPKDKAGNESSQVISVVIPVIDVTPQP